MAAIVENSHEISLNGVRYQIVDQDRRPGKVQTSLASIYPQKIVIGDTTSDSQPRVSVIKWDDFRGGLGIERITDDGQNLDRYWDGNVDTRFKGHVVLRPLVTDTSNNPGTSLRTIGELADEVYGEFTGEVHKYNNSTDTWGVSVHATPGSDSGTDMITCRVGGTVYLVMATLNNYSSTVDGASWNDSTKDAKFLTCWDDRLWGIDNTGQLWYTYTPGSGEVDDAQLPLPDDHVTALFVGRRVDGEHVIYASTKVGLYVHDLENSRFIATALTYPFHPKGGNFSLEWRGAIYVPVGLTLYKYDPGPTTVISNVGLDVDDGIIEPATGSDQAIEGMVATNQDLVVRLGPGAGGSATSAIAARSERGWRWIDNNLGAGAFNNWPMLVSNAYSTYRLWGLLSTGTGTVGYIDLPSGSPNPNIITTLTFEQEASGTQLITPWFEVGTDVQGLALRVLAHVETPNSSNTVRIDYEIDESGSFVTLGTITTSGITTFTFANAGDATILEGVAFREIRFRVIMVRDATTTNTPDLQELTLEFRKKLRPKWQHRVTIDLNQSESPEASFNTLRTAVESNTLVEFTFRNRDSLNFNYWVDVVGVAGLEDTGNDWDGLVTLDLAEA